MIKKKAPQSVCYFTIGPKAGAAYPRSLALDNGLSIYQITGEATSSKAMVVLPTAFVTHITLTRLELGPDWEYAKTNAAFQIEDRLVAGVEENCIAWDVTEEQIDIYVADKALIDDILETLSSHQIQAIKIIPQQCILRSALDKDTLTQFDDVTIITDSNRTVFASTCEQETLKPFSPDNVQAIKRPVIELCLEALDDNSMELRLVSLLPHGLKRKNAIQASLRTCRPILLSCALSLGLLILYLFVSINALNDRAEQLNDKSRFAYEEKFDSSQSFRDIERLAKLQIERGESIKKMEFDRLISEVALPLTELTDGAAVIQNIVFDETRGLSVRLKFSSLGKYEQYVGSLKQRIEFDIKEIATTPESTFATLTTHGKLK